MILDGVVVLLAGHRTCNYRS